MKEESRVESPSDSAACKRQRGHVGASGAKRRLRDGVGLAPPNSAAPMTQGRKSRVGVGSPRPQARLYSHRRRRFVAAGLVLLAVVAAIGYSRRDALREAWLQRQSTESLRQLDAQENADALVYYVYARRLFDTGAAAEARGPVSSAVAALPRSAHSDLAGRIFALAGYFAADEGDASKAEDYLKRAEGIRPNDLFVRLGRGTIALQERRAVAAVDALT